MPQTKFSGVIECEVLEPEGSGTRLLLTQTGFDLDDPEQARALQIMRGGWRSHIVRRMLAALGEL